MIFMLGQTYIGKSINEEANDEKKKPIYFSP